MDDAGVATISLCAGGCGEPMAFPGMCGDCKDFARHYDAEEQRATLERLYAVRTTKNSAHLGAVEREPGRGLFTFLGWKTPNRAERLQAESLAGPSEGNAERRSERMAKLPRVQCGVRRMYAMPRVELLRADVPLYAIGCVFAWDALRWMGCAVLDSLGCFALRRPRVVVMLLGVTLGLAVSLAAWGLR